MFHFLWKDCCASCDIGLAVRLVRPMQVKPRKKGELGAVAKGPTCEEFEDVMVVVNAQAKQVALRNPKVFASENSSRLPLFSFDNPPVHQKAMLARAGVKAEQRVPLPPRSPDMHKVIEHCFGILSRAMNKKLLEDSSIKSIEQYKALIESLFYSCITKESIQADVVSLVDTYTYIVEKAA